MMVASKSAIIRNGHVAGTAGRTLGFSRFILLK